MKLNTVTDRYMPLFKILIIVLLAGMMPTVMAATDFRQALQTISPSYVTLYLKRGNKAALRPNGSTRPDELMERLLDGRRSAATETKGSGFIIDTAGHIVTTSSNIDAQQTLWVETYDGIRHPGELVATSRSLDIAIIKIQSKQYPAVTFAPSAQLGEPVAILSTHRQLANILTTGVVSSLPRVSALSRPFPLLQSDAIVDLGSAGAPMFNQQGEVLGMINAALIENRGFAGQSFAVPAATLKRFVPMLSAKQSLQRAVLGVSGVDHFIELNSGQLRPTAMITEVTRDSPAAAANLASGDYVIKFAEESITSWAQLQGTIANALPNKTYSMLVQRGGKSLTISVTLSAEQID
ncbi:MAG: trypsin-like peptidase domain-containing protein [Gammaproteobacteria bacterium]|nr:trypsin-like peptidase domain-containing protein [Gammaproteobacteria bacterium]